VRGGVGGAAMMTIMDRIGAERAQTILR